MEYELTQIVGVPTESVWSTVSQLSHKDLKLIVCLTATSPDVDASAIGKKYLRELATWFEQCEDSPQSIGFLSRFTLPVGVEGALCLIEGEKGMFTVIGGGKVALRREGALITIVDVRSGSTSMQGKVSPGDVFYLGTRQFTDEFFLEVLQTGAGDGQHIAGSQKVMASPAVSGAVLRIAGEARRPSESSIEVDRSIPNAPHYPEKSTHPRRSLSLSRALVWLPLARMQRKAVMAGAFVVICLLGVYFLQKVILARRVARIDAVLSPLEQRYVQARASTLSRTEQEEKLASVLADESEARKTHVGDPAILRELDRFHQQVWQSYQDVSKQKFLGSLPIFYDFRLITADFVASAVAYDNPGKLAVFLDANRGKLVTLSLEKKQPQSVSMNTRVGELRSLSVVDRKAYVLGTEGIYEVSLPLDVEGKKVASSSANWVNPTLLGSFASNLYVFDRGARQVWRYDRGDFSASPSAWLRGKEGVDVESVHALAIDGEVWMSTSQGKIYRFVRGDRTGFAFSDLLSMPSGSVFLTTAPELSNLYLLDPTGKRIVILSKTGQYQSAIISDDLAGATSLIVDEQLKRIFVLAGTLVYEIEL